MRYKGGKYFSSSKIIKTLRYIYYATDCNCYVEPFCGSMNIIKLVNWTNNKFVSDLCPDLIMLYESVRDQIFDYPQTISKEEWIRQRDSKPSALRAYYGFGLSYGGSWFSSYPKSIHNKGPDPLNKSLQKKGLQLSGVKMKCCDYEQVLTTIPNNFKCLIYCDIPYSGTNIVYGASNDFDYDRFWAVCDLWVNQGHVVIVSNTHAPNHWKLLEMTTVNSKIGNTIFNDNLYILGN